MKKFPCKKLISYVSGNSIITVDPHKTVFIALDTETLEAIRERAGKRSPL